MKPDFKIKDGTFQMQYAEHIEEDQESKQSEYEFYEKDIGGEAYKLGGGRKVIVDKSPTEMEMEHLFEQNLNLRHTDTY